MILAAVLLFGVVVIGWFSPRLLGRLTAGGISPGTALAWWFLTALGVLGGILGAVLLLVLPDHGPATAITRVLHDCWAAVGHSDIPALDPVAGTFAAAALLIAAARLAVASARRRKRSTRLHRRHLDVLRLSGARSEPTLWLPDDRPIAYSLGGRDGLIVASEGLAARLSRRELNAVLAHEQAHLRGRHHLLTASADVLGRTLRFVPLMRELPSAIRLLVELAADRAAATRHGPETVRSALLSIHSADGPRRALGMAGGDTEIRLRVLASHTAGPSRFPAWAKAVAGGTVALLAPPAFTVGLLFATGLVSCW
ncbi:M56 family metallopeptidase [Amycolatopsis azurea]|uniref:Peptidase M48 n=1 Tax=Amycolatopsis azurea DSM 43854 TaxID=1238180 RepID=M2QNI5_9PSEU|nr:M56 family metallopeptidase [Amycolatopsis azurea]EMD28246.1 Peptidase M48, Ste24p [Amycolatopsis azurea DSM 43854]OOC00766.1 peptidase M48 [Amycolatopsis azurea DSM 43854]